MAEGWVLLIVLLVLAALAMPVLLVAALVSVSSLKRRVAALEERLDAGETEAAPRRQRAEAIRPYAWAEPEPEVDSDHSAVEPVAVASPSHAAEPVAASPAPPPLPPRPDPLDPLAAEPRREPSPERTWTPAEPVEPSEPNFIERALAYAKQWLTSGNVPVKVGMLVLLAGVAALLKYASDQGWFVVPPSLRLAGISAAALAGLVFAWRKRESHRTFALAMQGGMIGILLRVVFSACKNYGMIGTGAAFALSVVLIAGLSVMAVLQESRTLAILGVLAGFMAPIWLSDGSGNHVALFSYYALLNAGIFAIAWVRPWRILNLLGFVFTWGIGTAWGVLKYTPANFNSTEPFLVLFFVFYLLLPLLYARKASSAGSARIDGCLLFGTPLVAFSLQAALLHGDRMPLAFCALGVAALYAVLARALINNARMNVLARGYAILAVGFATLAVPLALSAKATASVFALEGAGLVWLGLTQDRRLARWTGIGLQLAAAAALAIGVSGSHLGATIAIANAAFMGALLIAVAGFATAWWYRSAGNLQVATVAYLWALAWWLGNVILEIGDFVEVDSRLHAVLLLLGVTGWLAAEVQRRAPALAMAIVAPR